MLPTRVENALNLGRPLATKVDASEPGSIAWVYVRPVILRELSWDALRESWTRSGEASPRFESPTAFVVRYTLLSHEHLEAEQRDDLDLAMRDDPPEDWAVIAPDFDSLEKVLRRFVRDLEHLRVPAEADYPEPAIQFARRRVLDDVLGAV